ncbi:MAG TPA: response regulator [Nitrososphaeraceae archaeon]|nr:response regulator [Nitrososphaeraceae archaeon]
MFSKHIAIIDDDLDLLNLFQEALEMDGYTNVQIFSEPIAALNFIQKKPNDFGLVISDYKMPGMNGCELCVKLREINPSINFIIISAYDYVSSSKDNFKLVRKPIPIPIFLEIIKENIMENDLESKIKVRAKIKNTNS